MGLRLDGIKKVVEIDPIWDVKGDLPVATGADAATRLPAGTSGQVLEILLTEATGLKWVAPTQGGISADATEDTTWDTPIASLINNLNRIRYMLVTITGDAWGTVSHSIAAVWAKFHATTGHAHTGTGTDAPTIDHGTTTGRTDDDHERYFDKDGSKALTGTDILRSVDDSYLNIRGGTNVGGAGAKMGCGGKDLGGNPGILVFAVPNAAGTADVNCIFIAGRTDTPVISMQTHQVSDVKDPVSAQDVATKKWVEDHFVAK
jgi:hypothetical protein